MAKTKVKVKPDLFREQPTHPTQSLYFELGIPPSVNRMYVNTRRGGKTLTKQAEMYWHKSQALIREALEDGNWSLPTKYVWLYVDLVFYFPDRKRRDASNCLKILLDIPEGLVYIDDYTVMPRIQAVEYDKENPRVEVTITQQMDRERPM